MTLSDDEIRKIAAEFTERSWGDDCCWDDVDVVGFARAIIAISAATPMSEEEINLAMEMDARLTAPKRSHFKSDADYAEALYDHQLALSSYYYKELARLKASNAPSA